MSAVEILTKAVEFDINGRKMEAIKLYADGINELLLACKAETNLDKKVKFQTKISEYMDRAELLKEHMKNWTSKGEIRDKIAILDGSKGYSYESIFGKYLDSTIVEVTIEEPYLKEHFQLCNLVMFCELLVTKCFHLKFIRVLTTQDQRQGTDQQQAFKLLQLSLQDRNIEINFEIIKELHDRQVILSNGFVIKIGRGLHYFKGPPNKFSLGAFNFDFRECRQTNVDVLYCPEIKMK